MLNIEAGEDIWLKKSKCLRIVSMQANKCLTEIHNSEYYECPIILMS